MTKRIVIHFEDELGEAIASQPQQKSSPKIGDVCWLNDASYVVIWRKESTTSIDFGARPDRAGVEAQEFAAEDLRPLDGQR